MQRSVTTVLIVSLFAASATAQDDPVQSAGADAAAAHVDRALRLAGTDLTAPFDFFCVPGNSRPNDFSAPPLAPVRLFDNVYAVGNSETVVYAITTSEGIVLLDSGTAAEVDTVVIPGLVELGLDPADVRYVLLGHGHSDHYGGASRFQIQHGARVGTTEADWETIAQAAASGRPDTTPAPERDLVVSEGENIVVGDTVFTPVEVPGHTPGSLAWIFPVYDDGDAHMAGLFGGTVLAAAYTPEPGLVQYVESIAHYLAVAERMSVDVEIQNHPIFDAMPEKLAALAMRRDGDAHPFVIGKDLYQRFWTIVSACMQADLIRKATD